MILEMCIAPAILAGLAASTPGVYGGPGMEGGPIVEVQSCLQGPGVFVKAMPSDELYMGGVQWGIEVAEYKGFHFVVTPQLGGSGTGRERSTLPAGQQYMIGGVVGVEYEGWTSQVGFTHLSNGDWMGCCPDSSCQPNYGTNLVTVTVGKVLEWKKWRLNL